MVFGPTKHSNFAPSTAFFAVHKLSTSMTASAFFGLFCIEGEPSRRQLLQEALESAAFFTFSET